MVLYCIPRVNQSRVAGVCPQIVTQGGYPYHIEPEHAMGSKYNIMIEWKTWKITTEPLKPIGADEPETCTIYGKDSNILKQDGWRRFKNCE